MEERRRARDLPLLEVDGRARLGQAGLPGRGQRGPDRRRADGAGAVARRPALPVLLKEDAFNEAKRIFAGDPELLSNIDPDGLPVSFRVAPKKAELTEKVAAHFNGRFNDGVDTVLTAKEQVRRLLAGIRWIRGLFFAIAGVLLASSLFLIVNTIRLATFARRREIQVMKLVGATNWFIRVPFMCEGLIQGAIGAGLAFGGVYALRVILSDLVDRSKNLFSAFYVTGGDAIAIGLLIVAVGATVGAMGSAIGLRRFLDA